MLIKISLKDLTNKSIGIDVGIKDLAICSNGMTFKNINKSKEVKRLKKVLKRKQRKVSRKYDMNKIIRGGENRCQYKKTNNIIKLEKEIRLLHRRLRSIRRDRKSTRLNSSHANISYAVFCL